MNKKIIYGLSFMAGALIGGSVSWFIQKKKFDQKLEEEATKNQEYYLKLLGYAEPGEKDIPEELENEPASMDVVINSSEQKEETPKSYLTVTENGTYTPAYTGKMNELKEKLLQDKARIRYDRVPQTLPEEEVDEVTLAVNNDQPEKDIMIITADQFAREHIGFDKVTLKWWPKNKILSTEDLEILDIPDLIGTEWNNRIGEFEKDTVYVRNLTAETDYEILAQHDSYYDYLE